MEYSELQVTSNFSFLRGASHPDELVKQAAALGYKKMAITDRNSLAGIVRAYKEAKNHSITTIPACRLDLLDGPSLLAYPINKNGYCNLSALLTAGNMRAEKGSCHLYQEDVWQHAKDILFILISPAVINDGFELDGDFVQHAKNYRQKLGTSLYLQLARYYQGNDQKRFFLLKQLSITLNIPLVATNDVHYHCKTRRRLQDVLTCVREKCTISTAGFRLHENAERHLKSKQEIHRLFMRYPEAIENANSIADACRFCLSELHYVYPKEVAPGGRTPIEELYLLTWRGAIERFGEDIPQKFEEQVLFELEFVERRNFASYFLTVYDLVRFARQKKILCQGRGSAANSIICYCLGISSVDPAESRLLFARFMSDARDEPPDIDVDFEHERREEVMQYIYEKYGRDRAGVVATVTQLHGKGAVRDVGKAMGLSLDMVGSLSKLIWRYDVEDGLERKWIIEQGLNPDDPLLKLVLELTQEMMYFPRQLGQHTGGFVITDGKLSDLCPLMNARMENRTCIEWNKDDIEVLGFMKVDVLALGMLTCIRKAFDLARQHDGAHYTLANIPQKVPEVYQMISNADTLGVFQIESRAQMSMLPRLKPNTFYDLVIEVAIVRPGPIQGNMVHPYLKRRENPALIDYPSEEIRSILEKTLGVPLFQEQAMEIAIVAAGFTPEEADELRRSMATFKAKGQVSAFREKMVQGMLAKGYQQAFAERVFEQLKGFGSYGFPESHAASFALLVYVSCWLKWKHPDIFATALLNSMPMGFYQPAQIVIDAQKHGVVVLPVDVNHSFWENTLENLQGRYKAIRLGFRQIKSAGQSEFDVLIEARRNPYPSIAHLHQVGVAQATLEKLANADAFRSINLDRRQALWEVFALADVPQALFEAQPHQSELEPVAELPFMSEENHVVDDYSSTGLSLKAHPVSFVRYQLDALRISPNHKVNHNLKDKQKVKVAGLVLIRQRPGTAKGICFITIEDETGVCNLVVFENIFDQYRKEILGARLLMVEGQVQRQGKVVHVVVEKCLNLNKMLGNMTSNATRVIPQKDKGAEAVFHGGRNFK